MKSTGMKSLDKKSSIIRHDLKYVLEKNIWIFLVGTVAFMILIPFFTAGLPGDSIYNIEVTHDQLKFRIINETMIPAVIGTAVIIGLLTGASLFRFVQEKKDTTIFCSMGITRTQLFVNRISVGFSMMAGMLILPLLISVGLNIHALGRYDCLYRNMFYLWAGLLLVAAASCIIAVIMCFISGSLMEMVVYWACTISIPTVLFYGVNILMKKLCWGSAWGVMAYSGAEQIRESLLEHFSVLNPFLFFKDELVTHSQFMRPLSTDVPADVSWSIIIGWLAAVVILTACAWYILQQWKAENAGITGNSRIFAGVASAVTGFIAFAMTFTYLYDFGKILAAGLGLAVFAAMHFFWRKSGIFGQIKLRSQLITSAGQAAVMIIMCTVLALGIFNNADRFIEKNDIIKAKVTYTGNPSLMYEPASGSSTGRGYYVVSQMEFSEQVSLDKVKELHKVFSGSGRLDMERGEDVQDTVIPYDISFTYTSADGKEHIWYYDRASFAQLEQMLHLEDLLEVKQGQEDLFTGNIQSEETVWAQQAYMTGTVYLTDSFLSDTYELSLGDEDRLALMDAIYEDISQMTVEEKYFSDEQPEAVLMFSQTGEDDSQYFSYHLDNTFIYVDSGYKNTLKWLEENQLIEYVETQPEIEAIYLQRMDPYIGINAPDYPIGMYFMSYCADSSDEFLIQKDFGNTYTITEEDEITEIAAGLKNGQYMSRGGYLAAVKLKGQEKFRYMFLPEDRIPDFIRG